MKNVFAFSEVPDSENIRSIHSNKMSIELHSPASSRRTKATTLLLAPVAQPRKIVPAQQQYRPDFNNDISQQTKEQLRDLKLSPGTRQLRDHELTFFGVRKSQAAHKLRSSPATAPTASSSFVKKLTPSLLTVTKSPTSTSTQLQQRTDQVKMAANCHLDYGSNDKQWQLDDKPDLLKHSTSADLKTTTSSYTKATSNHQGWKGKASEPRHRVATPPKVASSRIYENMMVVKPKYDRKSDLQRDEEILDELSRAADEIMNVGCAVVSVCKCFQGFSCAFQTVKEFTEAEEKKKRSRESARAQARPLDTISEKAQLQNLVQSRTAREVDDLGRRTHRLCRSKNL
jgi:hypothetical protein